MAKMGNKFVAMCSVAVGLIYAGAYGVTADQANPANPVNPANAVSISNSNGNHAVNHSSNSDNTITPSNNGSSNTTNTTNTSKSSTYKDGTYTGSGSDRRGTVEVAVTIAHGKISNVQITNYDMHYSEFYIDGLRQEVMQRQSDNVDIVSGATSSSEDFQTAVQQALNQAQQA